MQRVTFLVAEICEVPECKRGEAMSLVESVEACSTVWGAVLRGLVAHQQGLACIPKLVVAGSILLHMLVAPESDLVKATLYRIWLSGQSL